MHVQMPDDAVAVPAAGHLMRECAESVTFLREKLGAIQQERPPQFWPENCHIRTGRAYREICELARELNVDLIVLASRGNSGLKRVFLGSTAERVVRFAACPVLVVRQRKRRGNFPLGLVTTKKKLVIRKILAPVDFSQCSMAGAMYAAFLARTFDAKLCLFHAVQPPAPVVIDRVSADLSGRNNLNLANARLDIEGFAKLDFFRDAKCATEIRAGDVVEQICAGTRHPDVDLAVISTHGRAGFNRVLLGSVAEHVVRYAECPVMVVPSRSSTS
jgi:nucleotide-binding universal stress UspA family protein